MLWLRSMLPLCLFLSLPALAEEAGTLQLAPGLAASPEVLRPGQCVRYQEGGTGFLGRTPMYWLEGEVLEARHEARSLLPCSRQWLEPPRSRESLLEREAAMPCLRQEGAAPVSTELALVRIRVQRWETPWDKVAATRGRLYRSHYLAQPLAEGAELEINGALLSPCGQP